MAHCYSIGKEQRRTVANQNNVPGPGRYSPDPIVTSQLPAQPKWSMHGTKDREIPIIKDIPGPGEYNPQQIKSKRATIIGTKFSLTDKETSSKPGPAAYSLETTLSKHGPVMGKELRYKLSLLQAPGPGQYYKEESRKQGIVIGRAQRSLTQIVNPIGPGAYEIPSSFRPNHGFIMEPRRERTTSFQTPGPSAYQVDARSKVISYKIGQSKRISISRQTDSPGPGIYYPKLSETTQSFSIGRGQRQFIKAEQIPGPGQYDPIKPNTAPKFSMMAKRDSKFYHDGPGPQAYALKSTLESKNIIFGKTTGNESKIEQLPGPGQYACETKQANTAIIFGREKRSFVASETKEGPGPGQYTIKSLFEEKSSR